MPSSSSLRAFLRKLFWLTVCEMKARYRGTVAGFLWVLAHPLVSFTAICFAFSHNLGRDTERYPLFLVAGLLPWAFVNGALTSNVNALCSARGLLLSLPVDPWLVLGAKVLDQFVTFLVVFALLVAAFHAGLPLEPWRVVGLVLAVGNLLAFVTVTLRGLALLQVFFRDTQFVLQFVNGVLFFLTPILYPVASMPPALRTWQWANPYFAVLRPFQLCLAGGTFAEFGQSIAWAVCFTLGAALVAHLFCRYRANAIYRVL
jgi:ABC-type polysaccharide/polyol phosphate export permease